MMVGVELKYTINIICLPSPEEVAREVITTTWVPANGKNTNLMSTDIQQLEKQLGHSHLEKETLRYHT